MKKLIYLIVVIVALALVVAGCGLLTAPPSEQSELDNKAKPDKPECTTIQDGTLLNSNGEVITTEYDDWGYNYQAHMFNGWYHNSPRPDPPYTKETIDEAPSKTWLIMKWSDTWISNKDCNGDGKLDRGYACDPIDADSSACEGAWLTNHQWGSYKGDCWTFVGDWVLELDWKGVPYAHDVTFTTEVPCESFSGTGGYPSGEIYTINTTVSGIVNTLVVPNEVLITITYDHNGSQRYLAGTIADDGTMSGDWTSNVDPLDPFAHSGTWKSTMGTALCEWDYFVKIVYPPGGVLDEDEDGFDDNTGGSIIWGSYVRIQQISNDPCAGEEGKIFAVQPAGFGVYK